MNKTVKKRKHNNIFEKYLKLNQKNDDFDSNKNICLTLQQKKDLLLEFGFKGLEYFYLPEISVDELGYLKLKSS
jgi:hypothetical protein